MAPSQTSTYFPPLDQCLAGTARLVPWKIAHRALSDTSSAVQNSTLEGFLADTESRRILSHALDPFLQPGSRTKSEFETKTAPIQVSQSSNGEYDLEQLKADALWLSEKVHVEELVALRVVVLEWQDRAQDALLAAINGSDNGTLVVPTDLGASQLRASAARFATSLNGAVPPVLDLEKEDSRRHRQLQLYLEEKSYLLRVSADLVNRAALQDTQSQASGNWIDELAQTVAAGQCSPGNATAFEAFLTTCIGTLETTLTRLDDPSLQPEAFISDDKKQLVYESAVFTDLTTALRLLLASLHLSAIIPGADNALSWFKLMGKYRFLQEMQPNAALPDASPIQCLASLVSVALLRMPAAILSLHNAMDALLEGHRASVQYPSLPGGNTPYYENDTCLQEINVILCKAALDNVILASPVMLAWSLLTGNIRESSKIIQQLREQQRAGEDESSDGEVTLRRRSSREDQSSLERRYSKLLNANVDNDDAKDDPPKFLAMMAVDQMNVFGMVTQLSIIATGSWGFEVEGATSYIARSVLLELVRQATDFVEYGGEIIEAILSILSPGVHGRSTKLDNRLADRFSNDHDIFQPIIMSQAISRYPLELSPLLKLLTCLCRCTYEQNAGRIPAARLLEDMASFTVMVPVNFRNYVLEHEDENENNIALTEDLPLFVSKQARSFFGEDFIGRRALTMGSGEDEQSTNILYLPTDTPGTVIKESRPLVIKFYHRHNALEYLGLLLSTIRTNSELLLAPMDFALDRSTAADIINLTTSMLTATLRQDRGAEECKDLLGRMAVALPDDIGFTTIVADIFESELLFHLDQSIQEGSLDLLTACAEYLTTMVSIAPERVWTVLNRSSLLGLSGGAPALVAVIGGVEVQLGRYRFLSCSVNLFTALVNDAVTGVVKRRAKVNQAANRFDSPIVQQDVTPERTMSAVISAFEVVMMDAWLSLGDWKFELQTERIEVGTSILRSLEELIKVVYGVGDAETKIGGLLEPAARRVVDGFASGEAGLMKGFARVFIAGIAIHDTGLTGAEQAGLVTQTETASRLLTMLLRTTTTLDNGEQRAAMLGGQLVKLMPAFATLLATDHSYKQCISTLLAEVVQAINVNNDKSDPPTLLGQLNAEAGKQFLAVISNLDRPLRDIDTETSIWTFLTAIMGSKQQWFAIYLLTGALPKDRLKASCSSTRKSLLGYALDELSTIGDLPPERALAMLKFVAAAQNTWVWATNEIRSHTDFLKKTVQWLSHLQAPSRAGNMAEEALAASEHAMAASLCSILAVTTHACLEVGDASISQRFRGTLGFLVDDAVVVDSYNRSLHRNLAENFARKFSASGCEIADFKRSDANPAPYGRRFYYDIELAGEVLGHEKAWHGSGNKISDQGFKDEFARANVNLSLYYAQKELLAAWRVLATTLCELVRRFPEQRRHQGGPDVELARTTENLLRANAQARLEVPGMDEIVNARAEMAFTILSTLVGVQAECDDILKGLLLHAWSLVRASPVDYDVATAPEDLRYYRTLLQVLYLAIQPHVYLPMKERRGTNATDETTLAVLDAVIAGCLVEIVAKVIAPGFRALCGNLHTSVEMALPADFALLTAILRALLSVRGVEAVFPQIADIVASSSLVRGALSLYSWSDRLAEAMEEEGKQDPVYGEVSVLFLLALSTVPAIAEHMALNGILTQLASANLSNYFRKTGGKGPFDFPQRVFSIWSEGLLPLCLNLLDAVGPPIAPDVSTFLNSFPHQLRRAETSLENRAPSPRNPHAGAVTLGLVSEAHSLYLISHIVSISIARAADEGLDANDVPKLEFDSVKVRDDAVGLVRQKMSLASRVVAVGEREEAWKRIDGSAGGNNVLMAKIVAEISNLESWFGDATAA